MMNPCRGTARLRFDPPAGRRALRGLAAAVVLTLASPTFAGSLAPGTPMLAQGTRVLVAPLDLELFELGAGGVLEPRADWTATAREQMGLALAQFADQLGFEPLRLGEDEADGYAEALNLHAAVAASIELHHAIGGAWALPAKHGELDWSFGPLFAALERDSGARYLLVTRLRDSYASAGRKVAKVALALLGVGIPAGAQVGYATLIDVRSGRVVWFNRLVSGNNDLRNADDAFESVDELLEDFPVAERTEAQEEEWERRRQAREQGGET